MAIAIAVLVGIIAGMILGGFIGIVYGTETLTRATPLYKELVGRGDAAVAMLKMTHDAIQKVQENAKGANKRLILADDLRRINDIARGSPPTVKT